MRQGSRIIKLTITGVLASAVSLQFAAAWFYVGRLIYPGCAPVPTLLPGTPAPLTLELHTSDGLTLDAWYFPSKNQRAVILLSGLGGSLGASIPPYEPLLDHGYGVIQIESRACAAPPSPVTLGYREIHDAAAALSYLQSRPEINPNQIGIFGFSMGGVGAIRTAARYPEIASVIAEGGYYNMGDDFVDADAVPAPSFLRRMFLYTIAGFFWIRTGINPWNSSPVDDLPKISPRPVLLIYGEHEVASGRGYLQFDAAKEPKTFWLVPGGSHGTNHIAAPEEYNQRIVEFFDQTLNSASPK